MKGARPVRSSQPRLYASPRRQKQAAETKTAILDAARSLFSERGWSGTGMRDVARAAEVSVETVYALFGSKPELFQAAFDAAVVGDLSAVAVAERPEFLALGDMTLLEGVRAVARMLGKVHRDVGGLERALREAAASDPSLGRLLTENEERRRSDVARGFELVSGRRPTVVERDQVWALGSFENYDHHVHRTGWSLRRYENWMADVLLLLGTARERKEA